jgi:hypothetical protein
MLNGIKNEKTDKYIGQYSNSRQLYLSKFKVMVNREQRKLLKPRLQSR